MRRIHLWENPEYETLPLEELFERLYQETATGGAIVMADPTADAFEETPDLLLCQMKWTRADMEQTLLTANRLYQTMERLAPMRKNLLEHEKAMRAALTGEEGQTALLELWDRFAKPLPTEEAEAQQEAARRLQDGNFPYGAVLTHVWLCRLLELEAPTIVLQFAARRCALALMAHWDTVSISKECKEDCG